MRRERGICTRESKTSRIAIVTLEVEGFGFVDINEGEDESEDGGRVLNDVRQQ